MQKTILLGLIIVFTTGCFSGKSQKNISLMEEKIKYLALGDSYTIGESVHEKERWPVLLAAALNGLELNVGDPLIIAKTGWTTDELADSIKQKNITEKYDLVSLLIGVNNQYRGRSAEEYRGELNRLLLTAINFAGGDTAKVFVLSIPDWGVTPFAEGRDRKKIAAEIDLYNSVKKKECKKLGITYFDITDISRLAANDTTLVADDGLHPSGKMYKLWVERIVKEIAAKIK